MILTPDQRRRLVLKGKALTPEDRKAFCQFVRPETILAWFRQLATKKYDHSADPRTRGRPREAGDIRDLVIKSPPRIPAGCPGYFADPCREWGFKRRAGGRDGARRAQGIQREEETSTIAFLPGWPPRCGSRKSRSGGQGAPGRRRRLFRPNHVLLHRRLGDVDVDIGGPPAMRGEPTTCRVWRGRGGPRHRGAGDAATRLPCSVGRRPERHASRPRRGTPPPRTVGNLDPRSRGTSLVDGELVAARGSPAAERLATGSRRGGRRRARRAPLQEGKKLPHRWRQQGSSWWNRGRAVAPPGRSGPCGTAPWLELRWPGPSHPFPVKEVACLSFLPGDPEGRVRASATALRPSISSTTLPWRRCSPGGPRKPRSPVIVQTSVKTVKSIGAARCTACGRPRRAMPGPGFVAPRPLPRSRVDQHLPGRGMELGAVRRLRARCGGEHAADGRGCRRGRALRRACRGRDRDRARRRGRHRLRRGRRGPSGRCLRAPHPRRPGSTASRPRSGTRTGLQGAPSSTPERVTELVAIHPIPMALHGGTGLTGSSSPT